MMWVHQWNYRISFLCNMNTVASVACDNTVRIWDVNSGEVLSITEVPNANLNSFPRICCSGDGCRLAAFIGSIVYIWNINHDSSLELINTVETGHDSLYVSYLNYHGSIVSYHSGKGELSHFDVLSGALKSNRTANTSYNEFAVDISCNGASMAYGGLVKTVRICIVDTCEEVCVLRGHTGLITSLRFNHDASRIASGSDDHTIRIWNVSRCSQLMLLLGHSSYITSLCYSSDGLRLISSSNDKSVRVWDVKSDTGICLFVLIGHISHVFSASFSQDGSQIISCGKNKSVIVWDSLSGGEIARMEGHTGDVHSVCFIPAIFGYLLK